MNPGLNVTLPFSPARLLTVGMDVNREQELRAEIERVQADTQSKNEQQAAATKAYREKQKMMEQLQKEQVPGQSVITAPTVNSLIL